MLTSRGFEAMGEIETIGERVGAGWVVGLRAGDVARGAVSARSASGEAVRLGDKGDGDRRSGGDDAAQTQRGSMGTAGDADERQSEGKRKMKGSKK